MNPYAVIALHRSSYSERYMKCVEEVGLRPNTVFANDNRKGAKLRPKRSFLLAHKNSEASSEAKERETHKIERGKTGKLGSRQ